MKKDIVDRLRAENQELLNEAADTIKELRERLNKTIKDFKREKALWRYFGNI